MNKRWIKTRALFSSELSSLGVEQDPEDRLAPFRFDLDEVVAYNESSFEGWSTIWLMGTSVTVTISVSELDEMLTGQDEHAGRQNTNP